LETQTTGEWRLTAEQALERRLIADVM